MILMTLIYIHNTLLILIYSNSNCHIFNVYNYISNNITSIVVTSIVQNIKTPHNKSIIYNNITILLYLVIKFYTLYIRPCILYLSTSRKLTDSSTVNF